MVEVEHVVVSTAYRLHRSLRARWIAPHDFISTPALKFVGLGGGGGQLLTVLPSCDAFEQVIEALLGLLPVEGRAAWL
jgi:hypothetical protein